MVVAMKAESVGEKFIAIASAFPCWRATTMSVSELMGTRTAGEPLLV
jgi:hypothetical protein